MYMYMYMYKICICICTCMHVCKYAGICEYTYIYTYMCVYVLMCMCIYIYICMCIHMYMFRVHTRLAGLSDPAELMNKPPPAFRGRTSGEEARLPAAHGWLSAAQRLAGATAPSGNGPPGPTGRFPSPTCRWAGMSLVSVGQIMASSSIIWKLCSHKA